MNLVLKEPKNFDEQLTLIKGKGFIIPDGREQECIKFLQKVNYYRLSAYFLPFRKKDGVFFLILSSPEFKEFMILIVN